MHDPAGDGSVAVPRIPPALSVSLHGRFLAACFALTYGYVLQSLPLMQFLDRDNYRDYAVGAAAFMLRYAAEGPLAIFANEPLWLLINIGLAQLGGPEFVMRSVIFIGATVFSYVFVRADPRNSLWLMAFLLAPQVLKNFITHLRQGLAIAIFYSGYFASGRIRRWVLIGLSPLVHASFFFILPIVVVPAVLRQLRLGVDIRILAMASYALATSLSLGFLAALVGARQMRNYAFSMADVSGLGFVFWVAILVVFVLQGKTFLQRHQEGVCVLLFYLLSYFFVEVSARLFESGMPLVLLAGLALTSWRRWMFLGTFMLYSVIQLLLRLASPQAF